MRTRSWTARLSRYQTRGGGSSGQMLRWRRRLTLPTPRSSHASPERGVWIYFWRATTTEHGGLTGASKRVAIVCQIHKIVTAGACLPISSPRKPLACFTPSCGTAQTRRPRSSGSAGGSGADACQCCCLPLWRPQLELAPARTCTPTELGRLTATRPCGATCQTGILPLAVVTRRGTVMPFCAGGGGEGGRTEGSTACICPAAAAGDWAAQPRHMLATASAPGSR